MRYGTGNGVVNVLEVGFAPAPIGFQIDASFGVKGNDCSRKFHAVRISVIAHCLANRPGVVGEAADAMIFGDSEDQLVDDRWSHIISNLRKYGLLQSQDVGFPIRDQPVCSDF